jgi:hypothetical protein
LSGVTRLPRRIAFSSARRRTPAPERRAAVAAAIALLAAGCGESLGGPRLLNGEPAERVGMSLAEATRVRSPRPVVVHGYLDAPWDDVARLCTALDEGLCLEPSIEIRGLVPERVVGLEEGCCSVGFWSEHELVMRGVIVDGAFHVLRDAS